MKDMLKKVAKKLEEIVAHVFAVTIIVLLFIPILICAIADAIQQRKLHLIWWDIQDSYEDLYEVPAIFILFVMIITIPLAIMMIDERNERRAERARIWELKHPGKVA